MGCCQSQPDSQDGLPRHRIVQPAPANNAVRQLGADGNASQISVDRASAAAFDNSRANHVNGPQGSVSLKRPHSVRHCPPDFLQAPAPWTRSTLNAQREAFWDTRVSPDDPNKWLALRRACESLVAGDTATAQTLLETAGLICPSGVIGCKRDEGSRRWGVYDAEGGALFYVPPWVLSVPRDVVEDEAADDVSLKAADETDGDDEEGAHQPTHQAQSPKGKGRYTEEALGTALVVKCKLSSGKGDLHITMREAEYVSTLTDRVREQVHNQRIKLILRGKPLDERKTLVEQGWSQGDCVNAFILGYEPSVESPPPVESDEVGDPEL
ncbi:hypothetical protein BAUCODRAFT_118783 [Baudoinia panamericana UAMH 10762]|uniref:Ubiquitin-like domain-containing protein n=1 Tax=Baudoinia panamericana (strain UAMH 10762) TaxID=717646 RepID=M2M1Y1_BAUPA|nr:uncharacterized protein BAUCODRAFT_118783 [Baudoinia panamericana UAMH 10762]EMD01073.1 hypothetical protein BAUCODRAFT_118783 [Baudoinia panamericana UAMH 10762]